MTGRGRIPPARTHRRRRVQWLPWHIWRQRGIAIRIRRSNLADPEHVPKSNVRIGQGIIRIVRYGLLKQAPGLRK